MNDYPYGACPIRGPLDGPGGEPRCEQPSGRANSQVITIMVKLIGEIQGPWVVT